jgi:hypothetical protein
MFARNVPSQHSGTEEWFCWTWSAFLQRIRKYKPEFTRHNAEYSNLKQLITEATVLLLQLFFFLWLPFVRMAIGGPLYVGLSLWIFGFTVSSKLLRTEYRISFLSGTLWFWKPALQQAGHCSGQCLCCSLTVELFRSPWVVVHAWTSRIWSFHGGDYEECRLLGCDAVWLLLRTDVSEERITYIIRVKRIIELGTTLAVLA